MIRILFLALILFTSPVSAEEMISVPIPIDGITVDMPPDLRDHPCEIIVPIEIQQGKHCDLTQLQMRDFVVKRKTDLEAIGKLLDAYERTRPAGAEGEWEALAEAIQRIR